jgi:hypothetical protein
VVERKKKKKDWINNTGKEAKVWSKKEDRGNEERKK